jgi:molybdopterin biosynthesis enzyme
VAGEHLLTDREKTVFLRVVVRPGEAATGVFLAGGQGSNVLSALAAADAFAVVPAGVDTVEIGEPVELEWFRAAETRTMEEVLGE